MEETSKIAMRREDDGMPREVTEVFSVPKDHMWYAFASDEKMPGATKIGDTTRTVPTRMGEWRASDFPDLRMIGCGVAQVDDDTYFRDHSIHRGVTMRGYSQLQADDFTDGVLHTTEAYDLDPSDAVETIEDIVENIRARHGDPDSPYTYYSVEDDRKEVAVAKYERQGEWEARPIQQATMDNVAAAWKQGITRMLIDASVRFGKTFTSLEALRLIGMRKVLVMTGKPEVEREWQKATEQPGQFDGWTFVSPAMLRASDRTLSQVMSEGNPVVVFVSLQDTYNGDTKRRYDELFATKWDALIVDEVHFGAFAEEYRKAIDRVRRRCSLHLSGTPFRILASKEFSGPQIVACYTRTDMLAEQEHEDEKLADAVEAGTAHKWDNPYFGLPKPVYFALRGNAESMSRIEALAEAGQDIDLGELFRTDERMHSPSFVHEAEVRLLLRMFDGEDKTMGFLTFEVASRNDLFRHMLWVLPSKHACDALASLMSKMSAEGQLHRLCDYEVINVAGHNVPQEYKTTPQVVRAIHDFERARRKTISLTVVKMTTGVTVPEWDTAVMLSDMGSPEQYEQATGRLLSAYVVTCHEEGADGAGDVIKQNRKPYVIVVDPDVTRVFHMAEQRCTVQKLVGATETSISEAVEREMRYAPIITANAGEFHVMTPTEMRRIVSRYAQNGIMEEVEGIGFDPNMLDDDDLMEAISDFRSNGVPSRPAIDANPYEESGGDLDVPLGEDLPAATAPEGGNSPKQPEDEGEGREDDINRFNDMKFRFVAFSAAYHEGQLESIGALRAAARETAAGRAIAKGLGIDEGLDTMCEAVTRYPIIAKRLEDAILNISTVVNDPDLTGLQKAEILVRRFCKFGPNEVATPLPLACRIMDGLSDALFLSGRPVLMDLGSKIGEFAYAAKMRCDKLGIDASSVMRSVTTSGITYVLTAAIYHLLGLDTRQIARFTSEELLDKDTELMARTLRQDKDFCQITLFDLVGEADAATPGTQAADGHDGAPLLEVSAIVSNPPYQLMTGGANANATPIYPEFVSLAEAVDACEVSMIMPARWYAGGRSLDAFREHMLDHPHMRELHDFPNTGDCFSNVNIRGGVCYFLMDARHDAASDLTRVVTHVGDTSSTSIRPMRIAGVDIFVRSWGATTILEKVAGDLAGDTMSRHVANRMLFGIPSNASKTDSFRGSPSGMTSPVGCYARGRRLGYVERDMVTGGQSEVDAWKVFVPRANNIGTELADDNLNSFVGRPGEVSTSAYVAVGADMGLDEDAATALAKYLRTKFARTLHSLAKSGQDFVPKTMRFVPVQDFSPDGDIDWSQGVDDIDRQLFDRYALTEEEREFVRNCVVDQA